MSQLKTGRPSRKEQAIAAVQVNEAEEKTRLNINISKKFYRQVKQIALDEELSITDIVKKALNEYMSKSSFDNMSK